VTLKMTSIRRLIVLSAFVLCTITGDIRFVGAQTRPSLLLVVNRGENTLAFVDLMTAKVINRVTTGKEPHEVAVSPDGKLAFVANMGDNTISIVDVTARKELRHVSVAPGIKPHGIFYAGGKLYFTAEGPQLIGSYDPLSDQVEWLLPNEDPNKKFPEDGMLVVTRDAKKIFTTNNRSKNITALEHVSGAPGVPGWAPTVIPVTDEPMGIDISPDGKEVWESQDNGDVAIIDVTKLKLTQTLDVKANKSNRLHFTPDGKRVLVSGRLAEEVILVDAVGRKEIKRWKFPSRPTDIVVAPDGSHAYVSLPVDNSVEIVDLKTLELTGSIPTGMRPEGMACVGSRE
jgi:YVTN family beta-propeller protein